MTMFWDLEGGGGGGEENEVTHLTVVAREVNELKTWSWMSMKLQVQTLPTSSSTTAEVEKSSLGVTIV